MKILIVEDEEAIAYSLKCSFKEHEVDVFYDSIKVIESLKSGKEYDILFIDFKLSSLSGLDVLIEAKKYLTSYRSLLITAYSSKDLLEDTINKDLINGIVNKPIEDFDDFKEKVNRLYQELLEERKEKIKLDFLQSRYTDSTLVYESVAMKKIVTTAKKYAKSNANVIITGENGVGKDIVANILHYDSKRYNKPFVKVNCAAIPENLFESELFGYRKGAFTGATTDKPGKFELANEGTIFLDELGELPLHLQSKLLRVIENKEVSSLGSTSPVKIDVRVISATNKNLKELIEAGKFREDLFYRLNVLNINIPALRDRSEDISVLANHFLSLIISEEGGPIKIFDESAIIELSSYNYKGNIRELKNIVYRLYLNCESTVIFDHNIKLLLENDSINYDSNLFIETRPFSEFRDLSDKKYLQKQLELNGFSISKTAKNLQLHVSNLSRKLKELNIIVKKHGS